MKGIISTSVLAFLLATVAEGALFEGGPCIRSDGLRGSCSSSCQPSCSSSIAEDICGYRGLKADDVITCCLKPGENPRFKATIKAYPNLDGICNHYHRNKTLSCLGSTPVKPFDSGTFDPHTHLAAIGWSNLNGVSWRCTGTLISDRHVVASAHCLADQLNSPDTIRMGASELNNFPDGGDYGIKRVIYHPEYDPSESYNDLVVLEIVKKNPRDTSVHLPACIWTHQDLKTRAASAYGYGNGSPQKIESESSEIIDTLMRMLMYRSLLASRPSGSPVKLKYQLYILVSFPMLIGWKRL